MTVLTRNLPSFNGVQEGGTATLDLPLGLTYKGIMLLRGGTNFDQADLAESRVKGNGRLLYTVSGADMQLQNQYDGLFNISGNFTYLDFERPKLKTKAATELTAIGTGSPIVTDPSSPLFNPTPLTTLQLEIDISGSTAPTLSATAYQIGPRPLGVLKKRRKFVYTASGAGELEIATLARGDVIDKIWFIPSADVITDIRLERDNFIVFQRSAALNDQYQNEFDVRVPQAGMEVIDPSEQGFGNQSIATNVNDFRLIITTSGAADITTYVDYLGGLAGN